MPTPTFVKVFEAAVVTGDLSPTEGKIIFSREGSSLYRKGYKGSMSSQIWLYDGETEDFSSPIKGGGFAYRSPMWSENENLFYYVSNESGTFNIWKYDVESEKKEQLTNHKEDSVILPSISRNGEFIVYRNLFDFYLLDTGSGKSKPINITVDRDIDFINKKTSYSKSTDDVDFSSDGLEMVFTASYDLWIMDTILREPVRVTKTQEIERDQYQTYLFPRGTWLK